MPGKLSSDVVQVSSEPSSDASVCTVLPSGHSNDTCVAAAFGERRVALILK